MSVSQRRKDFFDFFPAPEFMLLSTAGVAITDEGVKFVQLRRGMIGGGLKTARLDTIEREDSATALKELSSRHGLRYVRATVPDEKAYLFTAVIDKVPSGGLRDAIAFILEENAPVTLSDSVFDFEVLPQEDPNKLKVIVSVLPKKVAAAYIELFASAGMTIISFDVESQAIARAIMPSGERRTRMIINLETRKAGFYVVEDGFVQFSTTLVHELLSGATGADFQTHDLKAEMRKVFAFWDAQVGKPGKGRSNIENAVLCGVGAGNEALVSELMKESPVGYTLADAWINTDSYPKERSFDYAPAIGLALPVKTKSHVSH